MKTRAVATVLAISMGLVALADSPAAVKAALQARYNAFTVAFQHHDIGALKRMTTSDYHVKTADGKISMDKAKMLHDFGNEMAMFSNVTWHRSIQKLTVHGSVATALVNGVFTGTMSHGKAHQFLLKSQTQDTWVKRGGEWLLQYSDALHLHPFMDGKPLKGM